MLFGKQNKGNNLFFHCTQYSSNAFFLALVVGNEEMFPVKRNLAQTPQHILCITNAYTHCIDSYGFYQKRPML